MFHKHILFENHFAVYLIVIIESENYCQHCVSKYLELDLVFCDFDFQKKIIIFMPLQLKYGTQRHVLLVLSAISSHQIWSSLLFLHFCVDLNETWQECCTTSVDFHVGDNSCFDKFCGSYSSSHLELAHILPCLLNFSNIVAWISMKLGRCVVPQV